jgi:mRNA interferase MazF
MNVSRGDIVTARIMFSDQTGAKHRPALVVSTDRNNAVLDDVVLASVSSYTRPGAITHVFVDPATAAGASSGLLYPSYIQCENLFTMDKGLISRKMGHVSAPIQQQVDQCLRVELELP